jgi:hypothetical protein
MFSNLETSNKIIHNNKPKVTHARGYISQFPQSSKLTCLQKGRKLHIYSNLSTLLLPVWQWCQSRADDLLASQEGLCSMELVI